MEAAQHDHNAAQKSSELCSSSLIPLRPQYELLGYSSQTQACRPSGLSRVEADACWRGCANQVRRWSQGTVEEEKTYSNSVPKSLLNSALFLCKLPSSLVPAKCSKFVTSGLLRTLRKKTPPLRSLLLTNYPQSQNSRSYTP